MTSTNRNGRHAAGRQVSRTAVVKHDDADEVEWARVVEEPWMEADPFASKVDFARLMN